MAISATQWQDLKFMGSGPNRLWMYHTTDAIGTVVAANYFVDPNMDDEGPMIRPNDVIIVVCSTGGTRTVDVLVVATSTTTACTVINGT